MPPITEIGFGDEDARRVSKTFGGINDASGPVVPVVSATPAQIAAGGVALIQFGAAIPSSGFVLQISADTQDYNVYNEFVALYGIPPDDVELEVIVDPGVTVSGSDPAGTAITWGNAWTGTPVFTLTNEGSIIGGQSENAGSGGFQSGINVDGHGTAGQPGGNALDLSGQTVSIDNGSGSIWGAGGSGGGGGCGVVIKNGFFARAVGGGGGGGAPATAGGSRQNPVNTDTGGTWISVEATNGSAGPAGAAGTGGTMTGNGGEAGVLATGGDGGDGGDYGDAGIAGNAGSFVDDGEGGIAGPGGAAGAAGKAIELSGGTANFTSGSGSPNVKGAVS